MKITFDSGAVNKTNNGKDSLERAENKKASGTFRKANAAYRMDLFGNREENWEKNFCKTAKGKDIREFQQELQNVDTTILRNYMTVMSHTMSEEDFAKMEKEGFDFKNMDPQTAVTIVDKIKAELAKSGKNIIGYTDDINLDTLTAAVGSEGLAKRIVQAFRQMDVPVTEDNIEQTKQAADMASYLRTPGAEEYRYMVDNEMEADIKSFYLAQNSGAAESADNGNRHGVDYYQDEIEGYFSKAADAGWIDKLEQQIEKAMIQEGFNLTEEVKKAAVWLVEKNLPLTKENILGLIHLTSVEFPVSPETAVQASAAAIAEGRLALEGNLSEPKSIYQRAGEWMEHFFSMPLPSSNQLIARRQMEEIRLRMTVETNIKLLRSGFSIDTAPMEDLIEALKQAEEQIAQEYFPKDSNSVEKYGQYRTVVNVVAEIPFFPAEIMGTWSSRIRDGSLSEFYYEGKELVESYKKAEESYEALMTTPRSDMGDHIRKAFANVDDILMDLDLECTKENRKSVRILGYNRMEITTENIFTVKQAEETVHRMIEEMTPAATLKMIRDGVNPLEKSFEELEQYFKNLPPEFSQEAESYSRFLYGLEQNHGITEEERSAFIGIYRLLRQVEKTDGAAVGTLVNTQAELNFSNLLSAVRTNKTKHINVEVSDALGTLTHLEQQGISISEQINQGYGNAWGMVLTSVSESEESQKSYRKQEIEQLRQTAISDHECIALLQKGEITVSANNLLAVQGLLNKQEVPFRKWKQEIERKKEVTNVSNEKMSQMKELNTEDVWEELHEKEPFQEVYQSMVDNMSQVIEEMTFDTGQSSLEVKEMQLLHKQLYIMGQLAKQEEYMIPMYIGEELTNVHLTIEQGTDEKGKVSISTDLDELGHVEGRFQIQDGKISGYFAGNTDVAVMKLKTIADIFTDSVSQEWQVNSIQVIQGLPKSENPGVHSETTNEELYRVAKYFLSAMKEI